MDKHVFVVLKNTENISTFSNLKKVWDKLKLQKKRIAWYPAGKKQIHKSVNSYATLHRLMINKKDLIIEIPTGFLTIKKSLIQ